MTATVTKTPMIAYVRVSTGKQARSGLGKAAQVASIHRFAEAEGFDPFWVVTRHADILAVSRQNE